MQIHFAAAAPTDVRLHARLVNQGQALAGLDPALVEGAAASKFAGRTAQLFEGFASVDGSVKRIALVGAGEADAADRRANCERAGSALTAKYLVSGETALVLDLAHAALSADQAAAVLLGLRLRGWRHDKYRTKLPADKRPSLTTIHVIGAPDGTEAAWAREAALAKGVEFTRGLVTEPANVIYPASFVAACEEAFAGTGAEMTGSTSGPPKRSITVARIVFGTAGAVSSIVRGCVVIAIRDSFNRWQDSGGRRPLPWRPPLPPTHSASRTRAAHRRLRRHRAGWSGCCDPRRARSPRRRGRPGR